MIIIGIDPSLNSSAITIYKNNKYSYYNYTNNKSNNKWVKESDDIIEFHFHSHKENDDFSKSEVMKLEVYDEITDNIVNNIIEITDGEETKVFIEGYSYSSAAGRLIDLVTFSTLLRYKLLKNMNIVLHVVPPSSLKKSIGEIVYGIGKDKVARNEDGIAAGNFKKKEMMNALLKFDIRGDYYFNYIKYNKDRLLSPKNIPKPFDDINDSLSLVQHGISIYEL
jgi:hypothetical protein